MPSCWPQFADTRFGVWRRGRIARAAGTLPAARAAGARIHDRASPAEDGSAEDGTEAPHVICQGRRAGHAAGARMPPGTPPPRTGSRTGPSRCLPATASGCTRRSPPGPTPPAGKAASGTGRRVRPPPGKQTGVPALRSGPRGRLADRDRGNRGRMQTSHSRPSLAERPEMGPGPRRGCSHPEAVISSGDFQEYRQHHPEREYQRLYPALSSDNTRSAPDRLGHSKRATPNRFAVAARSYRRRDCITTSTLSKLRDETDRPPRAYQANKTSTSMIASRRSYDRAVLGVPLRKICPKIGVNQRCIIYRRASRSPSSKLQRGLA